MRDNKTGGGNAPLYLKQITTKARNERKHEKDFVGQTFRSAKIATGIPFGNLAKTDEVTVIAGDAVHGDLIC